MLITLENFINENSIRIHSLVDGKHSVQGLAATCLCEKSNKRKQNRREQHLRTASEKQSHCA